jgi:hypothetical protein
MFPFSTKVPPPEALAVAWGRRWGRSQVEERLLTRRGSWTSHVSCLSFAHTASTACTEAYYTDTMMTRPHLQASLLLALAYSDVFNVQVCYFGEERRVNCFRGLGGGDRATTKKKSFIDVFYHQIRNGIQGYTARAPPLSGVGFELAIKRSPARRLDHSATTSLR